MYSLGPFELRSNNQRDSMAGVMGASAIFPHVRIAIAQKGIKD